MRSMKEMLTGPWPEWFEGRRQDEPISIGSDWIAWAARTLRRYEMPPEEISAVLGADNPELVRRYMELHRERLEERLADQLRALTYLEPLVVQVIVGGRENQADTRNPAARDSPPGGGAVR